MFSKASIFAICLGCIFISACVVPQDRYFEIEDKYTETRVQLAEDKYNLTELKAQNDELKAKIKELKEKLNNEKKKINDAGGPDSLKNYKDSQLRLDKIDEEIRGKLRDEIERHGIGVERMDDKIKIRFGNKILFRPGAATFDEDKDNRLLNKLAEYLILNKDLNVRVEGHTDAAQVKNPNPYPSNWELSAARAAAVVRYLEDQEVDPKRLIASGRASSAPISQSIHSKKNRRVEIYISPNPQVLR